MQRLGHSHAWYMPFHLVQLEISFYGDVGTRAPYCSITHIRFHTSSCVSKHLDWSFRRPISILQQMHLAQLLNWCSINESTLHSSAFGVHNSVEASMCTAPRTYSPGLSPAGTMSSSSIAYEWKSWPGSGLANTAGSAEYDLSGRVGKALWHGVGHAVSADHQGALQPGH